MGKQPHSRKKRFTGRHKDRLMKAKNYRQNNLKDVDEVHEIVDLLPEGKTNIELPVDEDLPGLGQFHCLECSRFFVDEKTMIEHRRSKLHKKRLREMKETPYSHAEADAAAGLGNYTIKRKKEENDQVNGKRRKIDTV